MVSTPARHMGVAHSYCYELLITYRDREDRGTGTETCGEIRGYKHMVRGRERGTETEMMTDRGMTSSANLFIVY